MRINGIVSILSVAARKSENEIISCLQKTPRTSFGTFWQCFLSRIWICETRSTKFMYNFFVAHSASLGNFIYRPCAALTAPISSVWELRAAKNKERQISTIKEVLYHLDRADYNLSCIYVYMCTCKDDKSHLNVLLGRFLLDLIFDLCLHSFIKFKMSKGIPSWSMKRWSVASQPAS